MIRKWVPINLNMVFIASFCSLFLFFSCNQTIKKNKYNGKWILIEKNYSEIIILQDGNYTKEYSSDDLVVNSSGKFYLNRNDVHA